MACGLFSTSKLVANMALQSHNESIQMRLNRSSIGNLGLAGASDRAVGAASGATVLGRGRRGDLEVLHIDQRLLASVAAGTSRLAGLVIGGNVEGDEEDEVGADDADASHGSELLTGALAHIGEPLEVGGGEIGVGGKVDEALELLAFPFLQVQFGTRITYRRQ
jgi:hypothetical protein